MQRKTHLTILIIGLTLAALVGLVSRSYAQEPEPGQDINAQAVLGTAFNYQGTLKDNGAPANGSYDFQFKLFDAGSGGAQVGSTLTRNARPVTNGQFAVRLDFGAGAFNGQARFLEVAVRPANTGSFTTLNPRTELLPAPYAVYAPTAGSVPWSGLTGLNCASGQIPEWNGTAWACGLDDVGSGGGGGDITGVTAGPGLTGGGVSGTVTLSADPNYVQRRVSNSCPVNTSIRAINADGTVACEADDAGSAGSGNALNAADGNPVNAVYVNNNGLVGIGTTSPQSHLDVRGGLILDPGVDPTIYGGTGTTELNRYLRLINSPGFGSPMGLQAGGVLVSDTYNVDPPKGTLIVQNNVGIGTAAPTAKLDVRGNLTLDAGTHPQLYGGTGTADLNRYLQLLNSPANKQAMGLKAGGVLVSNDYFQANPPKGTLIVQSNVGIGTANPASKLDIYTTPGSSPPASIYLRTDSMNYLRILAPFANPDTVRFYVGREGSGTEMSAIAISTDSGSTFGNVGIGTNTPAAKLDVAGAIRIQGVDLAEPFAIAEAESPEPGMVVAIDAEHPGQLRLATQAYDRTVAGVISGAGDIKPGLILHQDEGLVKGDHPVALAGRVYVWADASNGPIQPGDLLTTSDTPGHAMKVTDYEQAQGAILGKAMSGLDEGKGLVLVLVSLQ